MFELEIQLDPALVADAWSLAPAVVGAISHHHAPAAAPEVLRPMARIAAGADALARLLPRPADDPPGLEGVDPETALAALEEARESYADSRSSFGSPARRGAGTHAAQRGEAERRIGTSSCSLLLQAGRKSACPP